MKVIKTVKQRIKRPLTTLRERTMHQQLLKRLLRELEQIDEYYNQYYS